MKRGLNWDQIPSGLDVLITHGPPRGILDQVAPGTEHPGCEVLYAQCKRKGLECTFLAIFTVAPDWLKTESLDS